MKTIIAATIAVALSAPAFAADLSVKDTTGTYVNSEFNASGVYLSATGGMEFVTTEIGIENEPVSLSGIGSDGWTGEFTVGYDWQPRGSKFGVGVFAGANVSSAETSLVLGDDKVKYGRDWGWLVGARVFATVSDSTLIYVGGGYTQSEFSVSSTYDDIEGNDDLEGYLGEIGIETKLTDNVFGKVSARYTKYEDIGVGDNAYLKPESLQAMAGLTFKFNGK